MRFKAFGNNEHHEKKSPLKAPPLRSAGQSLDEEIHALVSEDVSSYAAIIAFSIMISGYEWLRWFTKLPHQPVGMTLVMIPFAVYGFIKIYSCKRRLRILRQARDGEKAVGQYLEALREKGYRVIHDVVANGFNIDHVLIGPTGVFSIETKTISKPLKGKCEVSHLGDTITVNGYTPDRNPVVQAKAEATWLKEFIFESTGKSLKVRPVVLYPGWFITPQPKGSEVWVLNPKSLPGFLEHADRVLNPEDIRLINFHLARYQRSSAKRLTVT